MSFNLLKFKKNQKSQITLQEISVDSLMVGFDLNALFQISQKSNFLQDSFLILDQNERSIEDNIRLIDHLPYPWVFQTTAQNESSDFFKIEPTMFFKDGEFRSFHARHKINSCHPYLLKFSDVNYSISWAWWWESILTTAEKEKLNNALKLGQVKEIFFADELWAIHTYDHKIIKTKHLQWNLSPELFLKLFKYQGQYPKNFLNWCSSFVPLNFLLLQVKIAPKTVEVKDRVLIPLTMGTDEGYFLLSKKDDFYNLLFVFKESDLQEEDVANKIRLMKKQMMKIFNLVESSFKEERVFFLPQFTFVANSDIDRVSDFIQNSEIFQFDPQYSFKNSENFPSFFEKIISAAHPQIIDSSVPENYSPSL
jgi:hypothetical protein